MPRGHHANRQAHDRLRAILRIDTPMKRLASRFPGLAARVESARGLGLRRFARNAATFSAGTLGAQLIGVAIMPFVTRLYGADAFGVFSVFSSVVGVLSFLICLRLDFAVPLPASHRMALALIQMAALAVTMLTLAICAIVALMQAFSLLKLFGVVGPFLWSLGFAAPAAALQLVFAGWNVREREFRTLSFSQITAALITCLVQLVGGLLGAGPLGLILGLSLGWWAAAAVQFRTIARTLRLRGRTTFRLMHRATMAYKHFMVWTLPSSVINSLGVQLVPVVVVLLYGARSGGLFFLAYRIVSLPMSLIGSGLGRVLWAEIARVRRTQPQRLMPLFLAVSFGALALTAPGLLLLPFAPELFAFAFGRQWVEAGTLASVLFFSAWVGVFITPSSNLSTLGYNHWQTGWEFFQVAITLAIAGLAALLHLPLRQFVMALAGGWAFAFLVLFGLNIIAITRTVKGKRSLLT